MTTSQSISDFYTRHETANTELNARLNVFLARYRSLRATRNRPLRILDIGCGREMLLARHLEGGDEYWGCDIVPADLVGSPRFRSVDLNEESLAGQFEGPFDLVFCGEIVEHLFSPDTLLDDLHGLLANDGRLLISTPNLAFLLNRIMLLIGISPFFLENSSRVKLGRRLRLLGQGNETQGHIRLFTYRAMRDLLSREGFHLVEAVGVPVWDNALDRTIARLGPGVAADVVYVVERDS